LYACVVGLVALPFPSFFRFSFHLFFLSPSFSQFHPPLTFYDGKAEFRDDDEEKTITKSKK
jgi:hypothetical protein